MIPGERMPMIRLEIEGLKQTAITCLSQHAQILQQEIQNAVDDYCEPKNLEDIINKHVQGAVDNAIKEEIDRFYRYGDGRAFIKELVNKRLGGKDA